MLDDLTNWLREAFEALFAGLVELLTDMILLQVMTLSVIFLKLVQAIPVPEFLTSTTLATALGNAGPTVAWALHTFKIGEGMALIGAGYVFRLTRKLVTLGQW